MISAPFCFAVTFDPTTWEARNNGKAKVSPLFEDRTEAEKLQRKMKSYFLNEVEKNKIKVVESQEKGKFRVMLPDSLFDTAVKKYEKGPEKPSSDDLNHYNTVPIETTIQNIIQFLDLDSFKALSTANVRCAQDSILAAPSYYTSEAYYQSKVEKLESILKKDGYFVDSQNKKISQNRISQELWFEVMRNIPASSDEISCPDTHRVVEIDNTRFGMCPRKEIGSVTDPNLTPQFIKKLNEIYKKAGSDKEFEHYRQNKNYWAYTGDDPVDSLIIRREELNRAKRIRGFFEGEKVKEAKQKLLSSDEGTYFLTPSKDGNEYITVVARLKDSQEPFEFYQIKVTNDKFEIIPNESGETFHRFEDVIFQLGLEQEKTFRALQNQR
jgi:hypothetical protein